MKFNFHAIYSKHSASYSTSIIAGSMRITRWEWGVGKGALRRRLNELAGYKWVSSRYFLVGARYEGVYEGPTSNVNRMWAAL